MVLAKCLRVGIGRKCESESERMSVLTEVSLCSFDSRDCVCVCVCVCVHLKEC